MSRIIENGIQAVRESEFLMKTEGRKLLEVRNAFIFWTNFSGRPDPWGNKAKVFNLGLTPEAADVLGSEGWKIRTKELLDVDGNIIDILHFVNIKVNMKSDYPPIVSLFTEFNGKKSRQILDDDTISVLDGMEYEMVDIIINPYEPAGYPGKKTGYLNKLNIIQVPNFEFGGKYEEWMEEDDSGNFDPHDGYEPLE